MSHRATPRPAQQPQTLQEPLRAADVAALVVDTELDIRRSISHPLMAQGMQVDNAADGAGALRQLRRHT